MSSVARDMVDELVAACGEHPVVRLSPDGETELVAALRCNGTTLGVIRLFDRRLTIGAFAKRDSEVLAALAEVSQLQAQLRFDATHDVLTGLANRTLLHHRLTEAGTAEGALIFIDLDDFKRVNDTLGHAAGDALLVRVAERIGAAVPVDALAARLGGDEFAVLLPRSDEAAAAQLADVLLGAIAEPIPAGHGLVAVTATAGVALCSNGPTGTRW